MRVEAFSFRFLPEIDLGMRRRAIAFLATFVLFFAGAARPARAEGAPPSATTPDGGFDEARKIWFPPDAPPGDYLGENPRRSLSNDVRRAFEANPSLRKSVCGRLRSPGYAPDPGALEPRAAQLRTMEDMLCLSLAMREKMDATRARKNGSASDLLAEWFADERAEAEKIAPEERRRLEHDLRYSAESLPPGNARARAGVRMIALRPSDDMGIAFLLEHGTEATWGEPGPEDIESKSALPGERPHFSVSKSQVRQFVTDLYRSMIEAEGAASGPFRSGWAGYLHLSGGDLKEARRLAASFVSDPADDNPGFETVFVAYLDRLLGNPRPLAGLVGKCPFSPPDDVAAALSSNYCRSVGWSLAKRLIEARKEAASPEAAAIVREAIRAEPVNWTLRVSSIRTLDLRDHAESAREFQAVADLPATAVPKNVRLDALDGVLLGFLDRADYRGALAVNQRWLDTAGYKPAPLPGNGWERLAEDPAVADTSAPCDDAIACMLKRRLFIASSLKDRGLVRRTLEERLAYALERGFAEETRIRLEEISRDEIERGDRSAALRIVRYLWPQPKDPVLAQLLKQQREALSPPGGPLAVMAPTPPSPW